MFLRSLFFLLPFFLYLGIAVQAAGFYLCCIFAPFGYYLVKNKKIPFFMLKLGIYLLILYSVFPVFNFLTYYFQNKTIPSSIYNLKENFPLLLNSSFSSSLFFTGSISSFFIWMSRYEIFRFFTKGKNLNQTLPDINPLKCFLAGLLPASILFCSALIYQHFTGFELRSHTKYGPILTNDNLLQNGTFRVYGFYGHPLTVAAVGLTYATFNWTLLWLIIAKKNLKSMYFMPFKDHKFLPYMYLFLITIANTTCVFLSSGRTATLVNIAILLGVPSLIYLKRKPIFTIIAITSIGIASFFIGKKLGVIERIESTAQSLLNSHAFEEGNNRQYFWKVYTKMFLDSPAVGQGNFWINHGIRNEYYNKLGFSHIEQKYNAHNNYLEILASVGIIGLSIILFAIYKIFRLLKIEIKAQKNSLILLLIPLLVTLLANLFHATTQNVFFDSSFIYINIAIIYVIIWQIIDNKRNALN